MNRRLGKRSLTERMAGWSWNKTKDLFRWAYSENGSLKRKVIATGIFLASPFILYGGLKIGTYEVKNHLHSSNGNIRGTIQKVSRVGPSAFGVYVPLKNTYEGYVLLDG